MIVIDRWAQMLPADPRPWLLASDDPAARWMTLTRLLDVRSDDANALAAHRAVLGAEVTERLLGMIEGWRRETRGGCPDARYRPSVLCLLADMGVAPSDDGRIIEAVTDFKEHRDPAGRFLAPATDGEWIYGPCEHAAVADSIVHAGGSRVGLADAIAVVRDEFTMTTDGKAWGHPQPDGARGPACPVGTAWALQLLASVPPGQRPRRVRDGVRTLLVLAERKLDAEKRRTAFCAMPWPPHGDSAYSVLDAVGRYRDVWDGNRSKRLDRARVVRLLASFISANFDDHGIVVISRPAAGFGSMPMAKKGKRSALATAAAAIVVRRFEPLVDDVVRARNDLALASA